MSCRLKSGEKSGAEPVTTMLEQGEGLLAVQAPLRLCSPTRPLLLLGLVLSLTANGESSHTSVLLIFIQLLLFFSRA